ncbi:MAG: amidohydrolase family protein, partial [Planctomycetaceae bacterium]|nr:amidohydrolase family protein [Planctomycetaceae bacterium]
MRNDKCKVQNERPRHRLLACLPHFAFFIFHFSFFIGSSSFAADKPIEADVFLKGGTIFDGSGSDGQVGDIAIDGDRIVGVGKFDLKSAKWIIDCKGLVVAPGFIDLHNHSDSQIITPRTRANINFLMQGCTTIVTGNCGSGPIDVGEYYSKINAAGAGTNVAHLLPQGALRGHVVGSAQRAAKPDEIAKMRDLADKAMQDGAWGMS